MSNSNKNEAEIQKDIQTEIEKNLQKQFPEEIRNWLRQNDPELYSILLSKLLPKSRDQLLLQEKLKQREKDLEKWDELLKDAEIEVRATTAELRFWERDTPVVIFPGVRFINLSIDSWSVKPWPFFNTFFDWILKIGLSVVPILSLFSVFTISDLSNIQYSPSVIVSILCGTSLVWLTSATVINWIVSQGQNEQQSEKNNEFQEGEGAEKENQNQNQLDKFYRSCFPLITKLSKLIFPIPVLTSLIKLLLGTNVKVDTNTFLFFLIWLLEALIGYATVPPLIDLARSNNINLITGVPDPLPPLTGEQKFEILFGVSIFAFINILFAIAKGRIYRINTPKKVALGRAIARRDMQKILLNNCLREIAELKKENKELERLLRPNDLIEKFHKGIENLSIWSRQGKKYSDIPDNTPNIDFTNNRNFGSPNSSHQAKPNPDEEISNNQTNH